MWVIHCVSQSQFLARYGGYWVMTDSLDHAKLFNSSAAADVAMQALRQEARDRVEAGGSYDSRWASLFTGVVEVREVALTLVSRIPVR